MRIRSVAKARQPRLKVFQANLGFYESVVAAPSQAAALSAWGVRQDLFAEGEAHLATGAKSASAALAHPGQPLRRALGSKAPFEIDPASAPSIAGKRTRGRASAPVASRPAKPAPEPPDRSGLDSAQAALQAMDQDYEHQLAVFERRRHLLDAEEAAAMKSYGRQRAKALSAVERARRAFVEGGGKA